MWWPFDRKYPERRAVEVQTMRTITSWLAVGLLRDRLPIARY